MTADQRIVLIVEPDWAIANLIATVVKLEGATPLIVSDGREALEMARSRDPAIVITALLLPYMRGDILIAALREERGADPPIILVSGSPYSHMAAAGADAILHKPFRVGDLSALLHRYLARAN